MKRKSQKTLRQAPKIVRQSLKFNKTCMVSHYVFAANVRAHCCEWGGRVSLSKALLNSSSSAGGHDTCSIVWGFTAYITLQYKI